MINNILRFPVKCEETIICLTIEMVHCCNDKPHKFPALDNFGVIKIADELQEAVVISPCRQYGDFIEILFTEFGAGVEVDKVFSELQLLDELAPFFGGLV